MAASPQSVFEGEQGCLKKSLDTGKPSFRAMEIIRGLDSRSFGLLDFQNPQLQCSKENPNFISKDFIKQGISRLYRDMQSAPHTDTDMLKAEVFCQLGHLHLLVKEYTDALSAYQQYQTLTPVDSGTNPNLHFGLGLIYFNIRSYRWAVLSFNKVLALSPDFSRQGEIHLRLGIIFKAKKNYSTSIEQFNKALCASGHSSFSKYEVHFHLGHIYYLQGHYKATKDIFEKVLAKKNVPNSLKATILRELGWLYHTVPGVASKTESVSAKAVELLKLAVKVDPQSSQAWYFLGRCHAGLGQIREAFLSYQQAVSKATDNQADIWCSVGILYHNMGQVKDSLQSYMCAVYLDPCQHEAWTNMGCLYEAISQPIDGLIAYKNANSIIQNKQINDKLSQYIHSRITNLEQYISLVGPSILQTQTSMLPTVREAWSSLVPSHIKTTKIPPTTYTPIFDFQTSEPVPHARPVLNTLSLDVLDSYSDHSSISSSGSSAPKKQKILEIKDLTVLPITTDGVETSGDSTSSSPSVILPTQQDSWLFPCQQDGWNMNRVESTPMELNGSRSVNLNECVGGSQPSVSNVCATTPSLGDSMGSLQGFNDRLQQQTSLELSREPDDLIGHSVPSTSLRQFLSSHSSSHSSLNLLPSQNSTSSVIPSLLSPPRRPSSTQQPLSYSQVASFSHHFLNNEMFQTGSLNPRDRSDTDFLFPSVGSIPKPAMTSFHMSHPLLPTFNPNTIPTPARAPDFNSFHTNFHSSFQNVSSPMINPNFSATSKFPGEWNVSTSLEQEKATRGNEQLITEYPDSQETRTVENREMSQPVPLSDEGQRVTAYLNELHQTEDGHSLDKLLKAGSPISPASSISIQKQTRSEYYAMTRSNNGTSNESSHNEFNLLETEGRELKETCADVASSSESIDTPLLSILPIPKDTCEVVSDSSSGVSSADTKLSVSSPLASPTIANSPSVTQFSLSDPTCLSHCEDQSDESASEADNLLDQIYEPFPALGNDEEYMIRDPNLKPPEPPEMTAKLNLSPHVPIYEVSTKEEAFSDYLHSLCCDPDTPVCMIRGLCTAVGINLNLFSSGSIVDTCPDHEIEVREQVMQGADENFEPSGRKQVWKCESSRTLTTTKDYLQYQKEILVKQNDHELNQDVTVNDGKLRQRRSGASKKFIKFGTNIDLSDWSRWKRQLQELQKVPKFIRVLCLEANLLSHIGHSILGVNSAQLYMKVQGARTPGHQENHNLCSVNINIGPGDCEWFCVHNRYWGVFHKLCEKHRLSFLTGSWWPVLEDLHEHKVPVCRFTQYEGDTVWLNPGTVHWVQANSVCNNIAWNVGPITAHQFRMAWERYMWNKVQNVRSIVPMIHLSWNIAKRVKIGNKELYLQLRSLLESSLAQTHRLSIHLEKASIPVVCHSREEDDPAPCCNSCLDEVFNILFVLSHKEEYLVYCHKCAMAMEKSFTVLRQYKTQDMENILTSFKLHKIGRWSTQ